MVAGRRDDTHRCSRTGSAGSGRHSGTHPAGETLAATHVVPTIPIPLLRALAGEWLTERMPAPGLAYQGVVTVLCFLCRQPSPGRPATGGRTLPTCRGTQAAIRRCIPGTARPSPSCRDSACPPRREPAFDAPTGRARCPAAGGNRRRGRSQDFHSKPRIRRHRRPSDAMTTPMFLAEAIGRWCCPTPGSLLRRVTRPSTGDVHWGEVACARSPETAKWDPSSWIRRRPPRNSMIFASGSAETAPALRR
ncbi:hypothetical protein ATK36_5491 [Amycolatopsis sulphurea]|uniref:Uncharacterized protein n=1 Tax=Amycolatopsis sulphurea TaxID=76022 RepID=A0A2A9FHN1_9PSEU|nr:hypothetical protein ATK36_5491 [Amycolatopsis sulphurea]